MMVGKMTGASACGHGGREVPPPLPAPPVPAPLGLLSFLPWYREEGSGPVQVRVQHHLVGGGSTSNRSGSLDLETRYLQLPGSATFERDPGIVQTAWQVR